jgi:flavin reductase (DIM6/NTAB) family NADH-FMN oxidoreductase RutF
MIVSREPSILYFGTPVALISSLNADGSTNLAPMSSVFWLGWRAVLGLSGASQTAQNLQRHPEAIINLPSVTMADQVDRLALTTGSDPVPAYKEQRGLSIGTQKGPLSASKKDPLLGGFAEGGGWALVVERSGWSCG